MKKLSKLRRISSYSLLIIGLVLIPLTSFVALNPTHASAASLPSYRYTDIFDNAQAGGEIYVNDLATDSAGNVYVVGFFDGTVAFDNASQSANYTAGSSGSAFLTKFNADGSYGWTRTFAGSGYSTAYGVAIDSHGNIYLSGEFDNTVIFDGTGGSHSVTTSDYDAYLTKFNSSGTYGFTKTFDASSGTATSTAVAVDSQGNVYITGSFSGTVVFDGVGGTHSEDYSNPSSFLTKYDSSGNYIYTDVFDTSASSTSARANDVATDSFGNVYITGSFVGTVVFDGPGGSHSITSAHNNVFLTKFNQSGTYESTKTFDTSGSGATAYAQSLAIDSNGNVYITGNAYGAIIFDGPGGSHSITFGYTSAYLTKFSENGTYDWTNYLYDATSPSFGYAEGQDIAIDSLGDVYLFSGFYGTITFDGPGGSDTQYMSSDSGAITEYSSSGTYGWTRVLDTNSGSAVLGMMPQGGIATDPEGNVYIASFFTGTVTFDGVGGSDTQTDPGGALNGFLTSYDAFIPPVNSSDPSSSSPSNNPAAAPSTGYGSPSSPNPIFLFSIAAVSIGLIVLGIKLARSKANHS